MREIIDTKAKFDKYYKDQVSNFKRSNLAITEYPKLGKGIMALVHFPKGSVISEEIPTECEPSVADHYFWSPDDNIYYPHLLSGVGFLANGSCSAMIGHNCFHLSEYNTIRSGTKFLATKDINAGDQIVLNYGNRYFSDELGKIKEEYYKDELIELLSKLRSFVSTSSEKDAYNALVKHFIIRT